MSSMIRKFIFEEPQKDGADPLEIEISDKHKSDKVITFSVDGFTYEISFETAKEMVRVINEIIGVQILPGPATATLPGTVGGWGEGNVVNLPHYPYPLGPNIICQAEETGIPSETPAPKPVKKAEQKPLPTSDQLMKKFMGGGS